MDGNGDKTCTKIVKDCGENANFDDGFCQCNKGYKRKEMDDFTSILYGAVSAVMDYDVDFKSKYYCVPDC